MGEDRDDRNGRWWSPYETQRRVEDLEADVKAHADPKAHVSKAEFDQLRATISRTAWLVVGQLIVVIGAVVAAFLVARLVGSP